jgi:hypothetical protein
MEVIVLTCDLIALEKHPKYRFVCHPYVSTGTSFTFLVILIAVTTAHGSINKKKMKITPVATIVKINLATLLIVVFITHAPLSMSEYL